MDDYEENKYGNIHVLVTVRRIIVAALDVMILTSTILCNIYRSTILCNIYSDVSISTLKLLNEYYIVVSLYLALAFYIIGIYIAVICEEVVVKEAIIDEAIMEEPIIEEAITEEMMVSCLFVTLHFILIFVSHIYTGMIIQSLLPAINAFVFTLYMGSLIPSMHCRYSYKQPL